MTYIIEKALPKTAYGDLRTSNLHPIFQYSFEYTVDNTELTTNTVANGGTVTQADAMAVIGSSTTTASTAMLCSKQHAKYRAGQGGLSRFSALFTTPIAATEQLTGLAGEAGSSQSFKNGYMIGYIGTVFGFHRFVNDAIVTVPQSSWNDPMDGTGSSGMTLVHTNLNVYAIEFQNSSGEVLLYIENDSTGAFVLAHKILYANTSTTPATYNPNFFHTIWVDNKATTTDLIIKSASISFFNEGKTELIQIHQPQFSPSVNEKTGVTTPVAIFTIRNKTTYASQQNFIDIILERFGASIEASSANNLGLLNIVKNGTLGGTPSWSDINTTDSVIEKDTSGTTVTGGIGLAAIPLAGKNGSGSVTVLDLKIILNPSETLSFVGLSANSATINAGCLWKELF